MRFIKVGIFFLLAFPAILIAQVSGSVESIGFDGYIRPDTWTPMVITVTPESGKTDFFQIHVKLQDLDRDLPIFQRTISVTGAAEGQNRTQRFRMYFIPPPTDAGLPDASDAGALKELQQRLKISLYSNATEPKWICDLPITGTLRTVDRETGRFVPRRGRKLIVAVTDGGGRMIYADPTMTDLLGVAEDIDIVTVQPRDLPESILGYDAVDAIVWLDADPSGLKAAGDDKFGALETYVRRGGTLVICQPVEWQKTLGFEALLPVAQIEGVEEKVDLSPLREMAIPMVGSKGSYQNEGLIPDHLKDPFVAIPGPYRFARAVAKPGTIVDEQITWPTANAGGQTKSPYLVRMPFGLGAVTWVAQDLGSPALGATKYGWVYVWNRVFNWNNSPIPVNSQTGTDVRRPFAEGSSKDIGVSLVGQWMDLQSKSAWLITLAVLFFLGYWLLAGPGVYALLAARKKTELSWFIFGACAFGATALTYLMYRVVLRGPPELKHLSIVRSAPGQPAVIISRFGLYIPRDGWQQIALKGAAPQSVTALSALPLHPAFLKGAPEEAGPEYTVPVIDSTSTEPAAINFKYSSTLKKFQSTWVGDIKGAVQGSLKVVGPPNFLAGHLTNGTEHDLRNIFFAFRYAPTEIDAEADANVGDWIIYIPTWPSGVTLDFARDLGKDVQSLSLEQGILPTSTKKVRGRVGFHDWHPYLTNDIRANPLSDTFDDSAAPIHKTFVLLSLFDRWAPVRNDTNTRVAYSRIDILRRGGRIPDLSAAMAAGSMIVLGESDGPLPMPLEVEGERIAGEGTIFYQFVVPIDRTPIPRPATEPATQPLAN